MPHTWEKMMILVILGWLYVVLMMAAAEAASPNGTVLGALWTLMLYGILPLALVVYIMLGRARRVSLRTPGKSTPETMPEADPASSLPNSASSIGEPDASGHAPGAPSEGGVASVGEKRL